MTELRWMSRLILALCLLAGAACHAQDAQAGKLDRTPDEWIAMGETVHGGFGSHIALGIRIGQDALQRLGAKRREVSVAVTEGKNAPCACVADGVILATSASPGQKTLVVAPKSEDAMHMAVIDIKHSKTGKTISYRVPATAIGPLAQMNPGKSAREKFDLVFAAPASQLYEVTELAGGK
jgi:formylmethanofuran dehydrogenase subunit E